MRFGREYATPAVLTAERAESLRARMRDGRKMLVDYADMRDPADRFDVRIDLPAELRRDEVLGLVVDGFQRVRPGIQIKPVAGSAGTGAAPAASGPAAAASGTAGAAPTPAAAASQAVVAQSAPASAAQR